MTLRDQGEAFEPELHALPEGWARPRIRDVVSVLQYGISTKADADERTGLPILRMGNIQDGRLDLSDLKYLPRSSRLDAVTLRVGDILFNRTNSPDLVGKSAIVDVQREMVFASYLIRLRIHDGLVDPRLVTWWINSAWGRRWAAYVRTDGVSQSNINGTKLAEMLVPLPPRAEQRRIVEKIEALLAQVDAARGRLAKVQAILKRFRQTVLEAACSGGLTEDWRATNASRRINLPDDDDVLGDGRPEELPATWAWSRLGVVASRVTDGTHQPPPLAPRGIPFLLIGNIASGRIDWGGISKWVADETYRRLTARCRPERGDVLYTAVGATFGQALAVDWDHLFVFQRHIAHIKLRHDLVHTGFLVITLNSLSTYGLATEVARGAAQPTVTLGDLKRFPVPVPPLAEQAEIARRVGALLLLADAVERRLLIARRRADTLPQAIVARAFSGNLVPTEAELARAEGRDYEPASLLLERIRAEHTAAPAKGSGRRLLSANGGRLRRRTSRGRSRALSPS